MPEDRKESLAPREIPCKRCYGTGEDNDGADCVFCQGCGTLII